MAPYTFGRPHAQFRSESTLIEPEAGRGWIARLSTTESPAGVDDPPGFSGRTDVLRLVSWMVGLVAGAAVLTIAVMEVAGRGPALSLGAQRLFRLALAAFIGTAVTAVHKRVRRDRPLGYSLARAQTLLCLAGALTMIMIDNSVARAFGVAGAASLVRFRTPVEDPTDATVLFLLMGLGMASGVGAYGVSLVGAAGVCVLLTAVGALTPEPGRRNITIELVSSGHQFPAAHVRHVFTQYGVAIEPCEWSQDGSTRVRYRASVDVALSLESLGADLMNGGRSGLDSVVWEVRKSAA